VLGAAPADRIDAEAALVVSRYRVPEPPMPFAASVAALASAAMDVSDGLVIDAGKIAAASGVAIRLDAESVPLSSAGHSFVRKHGNEGLARLITGGDDYQILFTAPPEARGRVLAAGREAGVAVALIGDVEAGAGVRVIGSGGTELDVSRAGHSHSLGR
jgi:thiamine-monophosphate kinase